MGNSAGGGAEDGAGCTHKSCTIGLSSRALASCAPEFAGWLGGHGDRSGRFVDESFPPGAASLGVPKPGRSFLPEEKLARVRWIRLPELLRMNGWLSESELMGEPRLDWDSIEPSDLAQGWIGNCWFIASVAALAEFPGAVQRLFVEADAAAGRYVVRLYDMDRAAWEHVEVDDHIPCSHEADWSAVEHTVDGAGGWVYRYEDLYNGQGLLKVPGIWAPLFGRPKGSKVWALLLEKAMAKFVGSYALLAGGSEPYALTAFTGFPLVYCFSRPPLDQEGTQAELGCWDWRGVQHLGRDTTGHGCTDVPGAPPSLKDTRMWAKLAEYNTRSFLMTASITKYARPETQAGYFREDGLVLGHAYSLLAVRCAFDSSGEAVKLLLLRNPHGEYAAAADGARVSQWNGAWSDGSPCWEEHPEVAAQLGCALTGHGLFWMCWDDFRQTFDKVCVLAKSMAEAPTASAAFRGHRQRAPREICFGLAKMADEAMRADLRQLSLTFDPFANLPGFLDDGTLESRLLWEASKPGRVQACLDLNKASGNEAGYRLVMGKVAELGLTAALGEHGCLPGGRPVAVSVAAAA
mmetsp:Transcript_131796/g.409715  ORF Transcript_131796/g.409715 Transcript_131796/m.409715 type:complete len:577 (+) Transcript_131796:94-1824(+)